MRNTSAHAIAMIALFVSLGGSAYAVGANRIGAKQIKENAVRSVHVRDGSLTAADLSRVTTSAPKAWANVSGNGVVRRGSGLRSSNIRRVAPGLYCISDVRSKTAQVSIGLPTGLQIEPGGRISPAAGISDAGQLAEASVTFRDFDCPRKTSWLVATYDAVTSENRDIPYTVALFD
jgi:hypothetical protein